MTQKEVDVIRPDATATIPGPDLNPHTPKRQGPAGSVDNHVHIFGEPNKVPLNPNTDYVPAEATLEQNEAMHKVLGIQRTVLVQPSPYGITNDFILEQVAALGENGRGVGVTDMSTPDADIEKMHKAGYRATRFNRASSGGTPMSELSSIAARVAPLKWHLEFFIPSASMVEVLPQISTLSIDVVIDHMGAPNPGLGGIEQPGFQALLEQLKNGKTWVTLSSAYRIDYGPAPWPKADPFARALIEAAPDRCLWGSDWPHPYLIESDKKSFSSMPNDGDLFDRLLAWTDNDDALLQKILVDNPVKLYDFST
jgi:predicted TIM-barrel fold metal-dependent hydrolase